MFREPAFNIFDMLFDADSQKPLGATDVLKATATLEGIDSALSVAANKVFYLIFYAFAVRLKGGDFLIR